MTPAKPQSPAPPSAPAQVTPAFVDGIENGTARLLLQEGSDGNGEWRTYHLPAALLPKDAQEGGFIELAVRTIPTPPEHNAKMRRPKVGRRDPGEDFSL